MVEKRWSFVEPTAIGGADRLRLAGARDRRLTAATYRRDSG